MPQKVSSGDAHERLKLTKERNSPDITKMIESIIEQDPFDGRPFYIFAHKRTIEMDERIRLWVDAGSPPDFTGIPDTRILWQSRLTKPQAQENSMLYKVVPKKPDQIKIIWILPEREKFHLYSYGKFFQDKITAESIHDFLHDRDRLEEPEPDDLDDETIRQIYLSKQTKLFD
jgi:hypothetical protein